MGLTKIHGWKGEAEILGGLYAVEFDTGSLTIRGLDLDTSYVVLETLAAKAIQAVRVQSGTRPSIQEAAPAPETAQVRAETPAIIEEPKKELQSWNPKAEFPDEPKEPPPPPQVFKAPVVPELPMEEEKPAAQLQPPVDGVPPEIQDAPNVISILDWLVKTRGLSHKDTPSMVKAVQEIAPHVGLLRRMGSKLPERIASTLQMFSEGGG